MIAAVFCFFLCVSGAACYDPTSSRFLEPKKSSHQCWRMTFYECVANGPPCFWTNGQCRAKTGSLKHRVDASTVRGF